MSAGDWKEKGESEIREIRKWKQDIGYVRRVGEEEEWLKNDSDIPCLWCPWGSLEEGEDDEILLSGAEFEGGQLIHGDMSIE